MLFRGEKVRIYSISWLATRCKHLLRKQHLQAVPEGLMLEKQELMEQGPVVVADMDHQQE